MGVVRSDAGPAGLVCSAGHRKHWDSCCVRGSAVFPSAATRHYDTWMRHDLFTRVPVERDT